MPAEYEQLEIEYPNELNKSNDEQLYLSAFEYNRARYPEEHASNEQIMELLEETIQTLENTQNKLDFLLDVAVDRGLIQEWGK